MYRKNVTLLLLHALSDFNNFLTVALTNCAWTNLYLTSSFQICYHTYYFVKFECVAVQLDKKIHNRLVASTWSTYIDIILLIACLWGLISRGARDCISSWLNNSAASIHFSAGHLSVWRASLSSRIIIQTSLMTNDNNSIRHQWRLCVTSRVMTSQPHSARSANIALDIGRSVLRYLKRVVGWKLQFSWRIFVWNIWALKISIMT